ncbi:MAG TPA: hypothetical protein VFQ40_03910 [Actinomycetota bacterium]|nr:hypothetical protein [Actinomycetota bacterium]
MRRALVVVVIGLLVSGCATAERPEGVVERWLLALNQGPAGQPERYATSVVSRTILPAHRDAAPGELDVIEVGRARPCAYRGPMVCEARVPFRVVLVDGEEIRSDALVGVHRSDSAVAKSRVFAVVDRSDEAMLPSEGGPPIGGADPATWLIALGAAVGTALLSEGAMHVARARKG